MSRCKCCRKFNRPRVGRILQEKKDDNTDGNGIGLYLVKEIIERSGGKIEVNNKENVGSTFKVFLKLLS